MLTNTSAKLSTKTKGHIASLLEDHNACQNIKNFMFQFCLLSWNQADRDKNIIAEVGGIYITKIYGSKFDKVNQQLQLFFKSSILAHSKKINLNFYNDFLLSVLGYHPNALKVLLKLQFSLFASALTFEKNIQGIYQKNLDQIWGLIKKNQLKIRSNSISAGYYDATKWYFKQSILLGMVGFIIAYNVLELNLPLAIAVFALSAIVGMELIARFSKTHNSKNQLHGVIDKYIQLILENHEDAQVIPKPSLKNQSNHGQKSTPAIGSSTTTITLLFNTSKKEVAPESLPLAATDPLPYIHKPKIKSRPETVPVAPINHAAPLSASTSGMPEPAEFGEKYKEISIRHIRKFESRGIGLNAASQLFLIWFDKKIREHVKRPEDIAACDRLEEEFTDMNSATPCGTNGLKRLQHLGCFEIKTKSVAGGVSRVLANKELVPSADGKKRAIIFTCFSSKGFGH